MRARAVASLVLLSLPLGGCRARKPAGEPFSAVVPYEVTALDPHLDNSVSNFAVLSNVYEPLVITDADMRV
ncbi:MAG TPA: hypothetical protein VFM29_09655, partial [Vicinamibacteria bacterium]|nr:hypothetical protein [Vicinamibacteria bacterium]